jgi:hypothetical protein
VTVTRRERRIRPLTDYLDDRGAVLSGHEQGGLILSPMALDALSSAKASGKPCALVATGEEWHDDGRHFLTFGVPLDYIEATTDYRSDDGRLVYVCPECADRHGNHRKVCSRG